MLKDKFKRKAGANGAAAQTAQDEKIIDKNDYWLIENNPLTKIGVFPYLGRQISPELEPDKIYQVLRPKEELTKPETLKSLELIPLVDEHTMLGDKQGHEPAEKKGIHDNLGKKSKGGFHFQVAPQVNKNAIGKQKIKPEKFFISGF